MRRRPASNPQAGDSRRRDSDGTGRRPGRESRPAFSPATDGDVTISALEYQKKNPERVNVYIDGAYAFSLSALLAVELGLKKDAVIAGQALADVLRRDEVGKAAEACVRLLGYRPRTESELLTRLKQKGYDAELAQEAVERVRALGYVDDADFARFWVRNREQFKPMGARRIRYELQQKGVDRETAQGIMDEELPAEEDEGAMRVARKKLGGLQGVDYQTFHRRLGGFLARQGFGFDTSGRVIKALWSERGDETPEDDGP